MNNLGKLLMSLAIAIYAFIPPLVDLLTDTHVFHSGWMPHARMHTVWLLGTTSGVGLVSLYLIWIQDANVKFSTNLAGVLSSVVYLAFYLSAFTTSLYGGALSDLQGGIEKGPLGIDLNLFTFSLAFLTLIVGWVICSRNRT